MTTLAGLPTDILGEIFAKCDTKTQIRLTHTCQVFRQMESRICVEPVFELQDTVNIYKKYNKFTEIPWQFYEYIRNNLEDLDHMYSLNLELSDIVNVSMLSSVRTLYLGYTKIADVSALGKVHTLYLNNTNVTDVSMLGNVHTLNISHTRVSDVSALTNVRNLYISSGMKLDTSMLTNTDIIIT